MAPMQTCSFQQGTHCKIEVRSVKILPISPADIGGAGDAASASFGAPLIAIFFHPCTEKGENKREESLFLPLTYRVFELVHLPGVESDVPIWAPSEL